MERVDHVVNILGRINIALHYMTPEFFGVYTNTIKLIFSSVNNIDDWSHVVFHPQNESKFSLPTKLNHKYSTSVSITKATMVTAAEKVN